MTYVQNLKNYRSKAKLTQQQVAEILEIPRTQLVRYEQSINELPIRYLVKLCEIYKVSADEILGLSCEGES